MVRRAYAPRGKTPLPEAWHRKGRVSATSAVTVGPVRRRPDRFLRLPADDADAHGEDAVAFLAQSRGEIKGPMTVLGDQSEIHQRSGVVETYPARHPEVVAEDFPGYAPDADPDGGAWGWTGYHRLPNSAPEDMHELRSRLCSELSSLRRRPDLLASSIRHAGTPLRL